MSVTPREQRRCRPWCSILRRRSKVPTSVPKLQVMRASDCNCDVGQQLRSQSDDEILAQIAELNDADLSPSILRRRFKTLKKRDTAQRHTIGSAMWTQPEPETEQEDKKNAIVQDKDYLTPEQR
ncbi:Hypothetical predicted protein [Cloeon dipterum]|uniref:Uncharacterized protein n=1 Tax=Cloeon dipterum TaxID=197152 RepID=A0A8S1CAN1_9INSE|nr:Hypothetical predicted protein [Cloeon dipterum]